MDQDLPHAGGYLACSSATSAGRSTASELTIVPGDRIVTARCDGCGTYGNPREFSEVSPRRSQRRLLGDVRGVYGGALTGEGLGGLVGLEDLLGSPKLCRRFPLM